MEDNNNIDRSRLSKSKSDIALMYGVTPYTLKRWLKICGFYQKFPNAKNSKFLTPKQIDVIFEELGKPNF